MSLAEPRSVFSMPRYILRAALRSGRVNPVTALLSSVAIGFSIAIFFLFFFVFINLNALSRTWADRPHVIVYLKDGAPSDAASVKGFSQTLGRVIGLRSARYVSSESAFAELKAALKGHEKVLEGFGAKRLPASFEISMDPFATADGRGAALAAIERLNWVDEVSHDEELMARLASLVRFIEFAALFTGVFLAGGTVFMVSNTIRLAVYARRDEIEILRLNGASSVYIKTPFLMEGVVQGILGGALSLGALWAFRHFILSQAPEFIRFAFELPMDALPLTAIFIASGIALAVAGSLISLTRFLRL
ncbi:MAG: ABC transporter permease [Deltaproteobacteria bacterium]|nr:ABC transporter permease [Deltaproteobacteria bacterium]